MDPNRKPPATSGSGSSGDSSPASPSGSSAPAGDKAATPGGNVFANDGSFMEMFKKKMEAEERRRKEQQEQLAGGGGDARASEHGHTPVDKKPPPVTSFVRGSETDPHTELHVVHLKSVLSTHTLLFTV